MARSTSGTSRMVVPVSSSRPNIKPMNNSGAAIQAVNPSANGPPMAKPTNPAARRRNSGSPGEPDHRWRKPRTDSVIMLAPRISRGRASGLGCVRISTTATTPRTAGSARTAEPMNVRSTASTHAPTGRAASNHELAAITTARPSSTSAIPSRRCPGSMSRARPIDRATPPVPRAAISQVARMARPQVSPAATNTDRLRRLAGLLALRRGAAGRALRAPLAREVAFDLLVRLPERATVLLGMMPRVVANTSSAPPATLVTMICQTSIRAARPGSRECVQGGVAGAVPPGLIMRCFDHC
jgi:hypothetical protein